MADVTQILNAIESGDPRAAAELLPLVYDELRKLASARMAEERSDHTLQPTALVHEAYLRLIGGETSRAWNGRGHFFAAAAEAMRRILVEIARRKKALRHGREHVRVELADDLPDPGLDPERLLTIDDALEQLSAADATAAQLVKVRYYAGLSVEEAGDTLGLSRPTAYSAEVLAEAAGSAVANRGAPVKRNRYGPRSSSRITKSGLAGSNFHRQIHEREPLGV